MKQRIEERLKEELKPDFLEVINNSHLHAGHIGDNGSGETHFLIKIKSSKLEGLNRVKSHRKINATIEKEFNNGLHALEINIVK